MMTSLAQQDLPVNSFNVDPLVAKYNVSQILRNFVVELAPCTNQSATEIYYWDPSAAMLMEQMQAGGYNINNYATATFGNTLCTTFQPISTLVVLTNGGSFGRTVISSNGSPALICQHSNLSLFENHFWQVLGRNASQCLNNYQIAHPVGLYSLQTNLKTLSLQVYALEAAIGFLFFFVIVLIFAVIYLLLKQNRAENTAMTTYSNM